MKRVSWVSQKQFAGRDLLEEIYREGQKGVAYGNSTFGGRIQIFYKAV